jgi:hypothetical protein
MVELWLNYGWTMVEQWLNYGWIMVELKIVKSMPSLQTYVWSWTIVFLRLKIPTQYILTSDAKQGGGVGRGRPVSLNLTLLYQGQPSLLKTTRKILEFKWQLRRLVNTSYKKCLKFKRFISFKTVFTQNIAHYHTVVMNTNSDSMLIWMSQGWCSQFGSL